ncbi:hypothetical protein BGZ49_003862, partial [Haplosporangium sp. Z 27]
MTLNPPPVPGFQKDKARIKAQQDDLANEVGRFCVDIIPKLFLKYSVDAARVRFVLTIPQLIPLNVYLDMRMLAAYEEVVDEVIKVFKKHSDPSVLSTAVMTIRAMQGYEILRSSHEAKIDALGANVVDTFLTQFSQNQDSDISDRNTLEELTLCLRRLEHLIKCTDVTVKRIRSTDQDPFEGLLKVAQRYRAVHGQDAEILISALSISFLWISWVCRDTASKYDQNADWKEEDVQDILYMQESLVRIVSDFTANNSKDIDARVRRRAFQILGDIYWLFGGDMFHASKGPNRRLLYMTCSESVQTECETFLRSELDLWNEKVREKMRSIQAARPSKTTEDGVQAENNDSDAEGSDLRENEAEALEDEKLAAAQIEQEDKYEMFGTVFSFMRQIMLKDFTMEHSTAVIARYGCFGAEYDEGVKRVVTSIKAQTTEGASKQSRDQKAETFMRVCLDSLNESIEIYLNGHVKSSNQALQLARLLATAIKPPGFMQSTRTGIDSRLVWDLHKRGIVFSLGKIAEYQRTGDTKKNKMVKYFDVLGNIPFGTQTAANESSSMYTTINFDYPIVSKAKEFKKFRKNLLEFYSRLIQKTKSDILFDGVFMDTLLDWTISLSSSTFRPVRHTATTVALNIITALAEIDTAVKEDLDLKGRQLKTSQKQKSAQVTKQLQKEITKGKSHEESVLKWIKEIFSSVYVLRCRDVDPLVRTDCIHELGQWMVLNPKVFIDTQYLRYIGMVLSDRVATVRLEALKVLAKLYEMENQPSQLQQFTTRSTSRFVEMAISESDTSARLAAIRVATLVHKHNYLEEEDLANLGALIFGANAKVRKSLAKFVKARVWESEVEGRMANCNMIADDGVDVRKDWIELRSLVSFLIKVCKTESESADSDAQDDERADISGTRLFDETKVGRITLAAEALWSEIEVLK